MKRIVISDESLNSYGFWVKTDGIQLDAFVKNPVMLWNHNRDYMGTVNAQLPIGRWKDLKMENGVLTGEPVFDEADEFAVKIMKKYEAGIVNACSMGFKVLEWSDAPEMLKPGQTSMTVARCLLREISMCDIPSNSNSTVVLYDDQDKMINLSDLPQLAIGPKLNDKMKNEIALKLGLDESASQEACVNAIQKKDDTIAALKAENAKLKAKETAREEADAMARKQEAVTLIDEAVKTGRIDAKSKPQFEKLFELDHDAAKTALAALPERKPMEAKPAGTGESDLCKMSWDDLDKADLLYELKIQHPEIYQQKFNEKFGENH